MPQSVLSACEGGRVADIPCGMLRSATGPGLNSIAQKEKKENLEDAFHKDSVDGFIDN